MTTMTSTSGTSSTPTTGTPGAAGLVPRARRPLADVLDDLPREARPALARAYDLQPHPEGGWFRRTWTSPVSVTRADGRVRPTATTVLFALPAGEASRWHRVASTEMWVAQAGQVVLEVAPHGPDGPVHTHRLGVLPEDDGTVPQVVVPAGTWQRTLPGDADAVVTCLVSPGFDWADLELA